MQPSSRPRLPGAFPGSFPSGAQTQHNALFSPTGFSSVIGPIAQGSSESQPNEPSKPSEINTARQCRIGQELVHEIVQKATDIFSVLKSTQLPSHVHPSPQIFMEKQKHIQDTMKMIMTYFKQLKQVYVNVNENCSKMDLKPMTELIPLIEPDHDATEEPAPRVETEAYKQALAEHQTLTEQLKTRNVHLKEVIDQLRCLLWEINTMLSMKDAKT